MTDHNRTSRLEYALGALGSGLVLAALVFVGYQGVAVRDGGPQLNASVVRVEEAGGDHVVHYRVKNTGGSTAEQVHVVGELVVDREIRASVSSTIAYVPTGSSRSGALVFSQDPSIGSLQIRAVSYARP